MRSAFGHEPVAVDLPWRDAVSPSSSAARARTRAYADPLSFVDLGLSHSPLFDFLQGSGVRDPFDLPSFPSKGCDSLLVG